MYLFNLQVPDLLLMEKSCIPLQDETIRMFPQEYILKSMHTHECIGVSSCTVMYSLMGFSDQK